jgi:glucosamine-6-phosphate deaminase
MAGARQLTLTVVADYDEMSRLAADRVASVVTAAPDGAITVPTGETPLGMYQDLVARIQAGALDVSHTHIFCLDEYLGVTPEDEASLTHWLIQAFLKPAGIPREHIHFIPSAAPDPQAAAQQYEADIAALGGLKLAVVGLGPNGHIAFNEPGSAPDAPTRVLDLTPRSIAQSEAYFDGKAEIPDQAITMGLGTILGADRIVLIVSGERKADILHKVLEGPETTDVPGSLLRRAGDRLEIIADQAAASHLSK